MQSLGNSRKKCRINHISQIKNANYPKLVTMIKVELKILITSTSREDYILIITAMHIDPIKITELNRVREFLRLITLTTLRTNIFAMNSATCEKR